MQARATRRFIGKLEKGLIMGKTGQRRLINSITQRRGGYYYAGIAVFDSVIDGGKGELLYKEFCPEPFINLKTARKHAELFAHEKRGKVNHNRKE